MPVTLKALKPKETDFEPKTLGEHIKRRRVLQGLSQQDAARLLKVSPWTVLNWETDRTNPPIRPIPRILRFLGYDPFPEAKTLPERMFTIRRRMGWSIRKAAHHLGVDESTWRAWQVAATLPFWRRLGR